MKAALLAASLLLSLSAFADSPGAVRTASKSCGNYPFFQDIRLGDSVAFPIYSNNLTVSVRLRGMAELPNTIKGVISFEVLLGDGIVDPDPSNEENWYQISTANFTEVSSEATVMRFTRPIECPAEAKELRIRFIQSNLRPWQSRLQVEGMVLY